MKIILISLTLTMWVLATTLGYSQETEVESVVIEQLEEKKEDVVNAEKRALKQEIELINNRFEKQEITLEEVETLKKLAAEKHALNIENKVSILESQISLIKRNGEIGLNDNMGKVELGIGALDKGGDFLLGLKINDGKKPKREYDKLTSSALVFSFGLNNVVTEGESLDNSDFKIGGSRYVEIGLAWKTRVFNESNWLRIKYGLSFQMNGLKATDNRYFVDTGSQTELQVFPENLDKSKFRLDNLVIPIHFELGPSKKIEKDGYFRYSSHNQFKIGLGGYAGLKLSSRQKLKYKVDGEGVKEKLIASYNTNNFIYGLSGYIGFNDISVYAKYDLNTIFKDNPVEQRNISLGLRWDWD
ncbi:MAG: hypothetical protein ACI97P_002832 [Arcticibacterium sp.]|jgi:hypothetical protein